MLADLSRDLRAALRSVRRRPGFAVAVVSTIAFGIAANTAIFSVVQGVLLRRLAFSEPDRLFAVYSRQSGSDRQPFAIADYFDMRETAHGVSDLVAWCSASANLTGVEEPVALRAQWTSRGFFQVLGVRAALGRVPLAEEEQPGAARVVLLGDSLWRSRFGADPAILGRRLTLNGQPFTVIGVLPRNFVFLAPGAEIAGPIVLETDPRRANRGSEFLRLIGRRKAGVSASAAAAELDAIVGRMRREYPDTNGGRQGIRIEPLAELVVGGYRRILVMLQAAVALVLLIGCANLANLLLARTGSRRSEFAVRAALGARRRDLARQVICESMVLALLGGGIGVAVTGLAVRGLLALAPAGLPRASEITIDGTVLAFGFGLSIVAGLLLGIMPALQGSRDLSQGLRGSGRGETQGRRGTRTRSLLVATEVGLSLVLLICAGLLLRTLHRLQATDSGFDAQRLIAVQLSLPKARYGTPEAITAYSQRVVERLAALPGVADAGAASLNPLTQWKANVSFTIEGRPESDRKSAPLANYRAAGPGYFKTLRVPVLAGRDIGPEDRAGSLPVALISQTLARRHFPDAHALGARLTIDDSEAWRAVEIVGVVGDIKHTGPDASGTADIYVPYSQTPPDVAVWMANIFCVAVRTDGEPQSVAGAIRRELRSLDPDVAVAAIRPMEEALGASLSDRRFHTVLLELFAAAALALALSGIYAVTAFGVVERTREIGVRLSLGSSRGGILRLVVGQALLPVGIGIAAGTASALALGRALSSVVFGVTAHDPGTIVSAAVLVALVALAASAWPAFRAARIDPVRALRAD